MYLSSNFVYISVVNCHMELETVLSSNLRRLITPELILQLGVLKSYLGVKSFINYCKSFR